MAEIQKLKKSMVELDRSLNRLESMLGNLSHPRVQGIFEMEKSRDKIAEYAGHIPMPKKSALVFGAINDRIRDMENSLDKLEKMVLQVVHGRLHEPLK